MSIHALLDLFEQLFGPPPSDPAAPGEAVHESADTVTFPRARRLRPAGAK